MSVLVRDSLVGLRVLPALVAVATVVVSALIAREFGGRRSEQVLTAGATATSAVVLSSGHLLSTTTVDMMVWALLTWLCVRTVRLGGGRAWLWAGLVAGIGLQNKILVVFLLAGLILGLLIAGPRRVFRDPWLWTAGGVAVVLWLPNLIWQAPNGCPQLALSLVSLKPAGGPMLPRPATGDE